MRHIPESMRQPARLVSALQLALAVIKVKRMRITGAAWRALTIEEKRAHIRAFEARS
jgi:hypothetical protein